MVCKLNILKGVAQLTVMSLISACWIDSVTADLSFSLSFSFLLALGRDLFDADFWSSQHVAHDCSQNLSHPATQISSGKELEAICELMTDWKISCQWRSLLMRHTSAVCNTYLFTKIIEETLQPHKESSRHENMKAIANRLKSIYKNCTIIKKIETHFSSINVSVVLVTGGRHSPCNWRLKGCRYAFSSSSSQDMSSYQSGHLSQKTLSTVWLETTFSYLCCYAVR